MEKQDRNIDQLFKEAFDSFEPSVSDKLWSNVSDNIGSNSIGASVTTLGTWHIVSIALVCGVIGASLTWVFQDFNSQTKKEYKIEDSQEKSIKEVKGKKIPLKEVVFTDNHPIDKQDPVISENVNTNKEFEIRIKDVNKEINSNNNDHKPSSIVNLFLTPRTKILNNTKDEIEVLNQVNEVSSTQVEIKEVPKSKLNPVINSSVSGGYVPLIVSFQQSEPADEVIWDFGDGTKLVGNQIEYIFREAKEHTVTVTIRNENGDEAMAKKTISVKTRCIITNVPNIFTPNGDNINETFIPFPYKYVEQIQLSIYNRWGQRMFFSDSIEKGWDGISEDGDQVPVGVYFYIIETENVLVQHNV